MEINHEINRLLHFALQQGLMQPADTIYAANRLLDCLQAAEFVPEVIAETLATADPVLEQMLRYAVRAGILEDTASARDLFDTRLMDCLMPRPSEVAARFQAEYEKSPVQATNWYYHFSIASNYIRQARIAKNIGWKVPTEYGELDVTINLSKPEKDPRDIARARRESCTSYPKCLLCRENEGFAGNLSRPARQTHRLIPLQLNGRPWYLQYSPYTYYNEHCIILNQNHIPMRITRETFANLAAFVDLFPHYFAGSNADLPIVGGSILTHDHYQGGRYTFAMERAPIEKKYVFRGFENVEAGRVRWPMSVLRLRTPDKQRLIVLADKILHCWRGYSDASVEILAETDGAPHNTITPIARRRDNMYEFDLVLRNNRTTKQHPLGIFHPHEEVHHIKKENIGLIEVLGLAILPARLKREMAVVRAALLQGIPDIREQEGAAIHADWYQAVLAAHPFIEESNVDEILRQEIGQVFLTVLEHAGVFKRTAAGRQAFDHFVAAVSAE